MQNVLPICLLAWKLPWYIHIQLHIRSFALTVSAVLSTSNKKINSVPLEIFTGIKYMYIVSGSQLSFAGMVVGLAILYGTDYHNKKY